MEMCRACLVTGENMILLDEPFVNGYNLLTNLNISLFDNMPQHACESCAKTVKFYLDFRDKCIMSESTLQQVLLEKVKHEENEHNADKKPKDNSFMDIKQEVKVEVDRMDFSMSEEYLQDTFTDYDNVYLSKMLKEEDGGYPTANTCRYMKYNQQTAFMNYRNIANNRISQSYKQVLQTKDMEPKRLKRIKKEKKKKKKKVKAKHKLSFEIGELLEIPCGLCKKTFKDKNKLYRHLDEHKSDKRCDSCSEMFRHWPALLGHRYAHLNMKEWRRCHVCNQAARSELQLEHHYLKMHYEGDKNLVCKHCLKTYETTRKLSKHINSTHSSLVFVCDACDKVFNNKQKLRSHVRIHSENKSYVCDLCGFSCKQSSGLKIHKIRRHTPRKASCKICQKLFASEEELARHVCKEELKVCPHCGIQVMGSKRLSRHLESHRQVGRYKCERCPAVYKSRSALRVHISRHDNVRSKQCEYCPLKFFSTSVLIKHRRVHTGEKPYVCKVCDKGFTGNHNLKVHMKVHGEHLVVKRNKEPEEVTTIF